MDAIVSGSARVAILIEGARAWSLVPSAVDRAKVERSLHDVPRLFGEARDLTFLESVSEDAARRELDTAHAGVEALHLALMICDPETSERAWVLGVQDLDGLLGDPAVAERAERILEARAMQAPLSPDLAVARCNTKGNDRATTFFQAYSSRQGVIRDVRRAWDTLPSTLFKTADDRDIADGLLAREGMFRELVRVIESGGSAGAWLVHALQSPAVKRLPNCREVLQSWVEPFRTRIGPPRMAAAPSTAADRPDDTSTSRRGHGRRAARAETMVEHFATPAVAADMTMPVRTYKPSEGFAPGERLEHPTFGQGVVEVCEPGKVTVFFATGRKVLAAAKGEPGKLARPRSFDHTGVGLPAPKHQPNAPTGDDEPDGEDKAT